MRPIAAAALSAALRRLLHLARPDQPSPGRISELAEFLKSVWPLVDADDQPAKWAEAFLVGTAAAG
jgi:hypothetical protein